MKKKVFALFIEDPSKKEEALAWLKKRDNHLEIFKQSLSKFLDSYLGFLTFTTGLFLALSAQLAFYLWPEWFIENKWLLLIGTLILVIISVIMIILAMINKVKEVREEDKIMNELYKEAEEKYKGKIITIKE